MAATPEEDFVQFLMGMRIKNWFVIHRWLPLLLAMSIATVSGFFAFIVAISKTTS